MNTHTTAIAAIALIIGLGGGYMFSKSNQPAPIIHNMTSTMEGMTTNLEGKNGDDFDKTFLEEMIVHHEGAVEMAEMVLESSERPELRSLAEEIISAQTTEIHMMREWLMEWFAVHTE